MTERRYREDEVRRIFGLAATGAGSTTPARAGADGLTLAEMQSIGLEVGLDPTVVASAAHSIDTQPARTSLGMPVEVGRIVPLPRAMTDREWEQLVAELRSTFRARGRVSVHGELREWSNGNLHACVEPTSDGYRLRLGTVKGDAAGLNVLGATGITVGAIAAGSLFLSGELATGFFVPLMLGASGVAAFVANTLRLPRWAGTRQRQMQHIAARVTAMLRAAPEPAKPDD